MRICRKSIQVPLALLMLFLCVLLPPEALAQSVNARNLLKVARSYAAQGDWVKAKDYANQALKQEAGYVDALYMRAYAHRELEEYPKAEEDFREVIRLEPTFLGTYGALAEMYVKQKSVDKAEKLFNELSRQPDGLKWADYYRGVLAYMKPDLAAAESYWDKATKADAAFGPALHNLGALYLAQGQPGKALVKFRGALNSEPEKALYRFHVAWALERSGQTPEAQKYLKTVIDENIDDERNYSLARALDHLTRGRPQAALPLLTEVSKSYPDNLDVWILLGRAHLALNQMKEASVALKKAQELDPSFKEVTEMMKRLPAEPSPVEKAEPESRDPEKAAPEAETPPSNEQ